MGRRRYRYILILQSTAAFFLSIAIAVIIAERAFGIQPPFWLVQYILAPFAFIFTGFVIFIRLMDVLPHKGESRRAEGKCVRCGYDMRGTRPVEGWVICPECGYKKPAFGNNGEAE